MKKNSKKFIDHILLLITIAISGAPFFSTSDLLIPLFLILFFVFKFRKRKFDSKFIFLLSFLFVITVFQSYIFNFYSFPTIIGVFMRVFNGYLIIKILDKNFIPCYINILYYISIISLIIYVPILIEPQIKNALIQIVPYFQFLNFSGTDQLTIVIYNISLHHLSLLRNSGPFWEPGAFAGYLMIAFIFGTIHFGKIEKKKNLIILVTLLTTLSTTVYLSLFIFLFFLLYERMKNILIKIFGITVIIIVGYYAFFNLDFFGEKIFRQLYHAKSVVNPYVDNTNTQRFLNILRDVEDFKGHEIFGRGSHPVTRYSYKLENQIRTVGLTDILVRVGVLFFIYMMFLFYQSICTVCLYYGYNKTKICFGSFFAIIILLMSEVYFNFPVFWSLLFLKFVYIKPRRRIAKNTINLYHRLEQHIPG